MLCVGPSLYPAVGLLQAMHTQQAFLCHYDQGLVQRGNGNRPAPWTIPQVSWSQLVIFKLLDVTDGNAFIVVLSQIRFNQSVKH